MRSVKSQVAIYILSDSQKYCNHSLDADWIRKCHFGLPRAITQSTLDFGPASLAVQGLRSSKCPRWQSKL